MTKRWPCPCCGNRTLKDEPPGSYSLCPVCFWEDDPIQFDHPDYGGGANAVSLNEARANFRSFGASEEQFRGNVRPAPPDEQS